MSRGVTCLWLHSVTYAAGYHVLVVTVSDIRRWCHVFVVTFSDIRRGASRHVLVVTFSDIRRRASRVCGYIQ